MTTQIMAADYTISNNPFFYGDANELFVFNFPSIKEVMICAMNQSFVNEKIDEKYLVAKFTNIRLKK